MDEQWMTRTNQVKDAEETAKEHGAHCQHQVTRENSTKEMHCDFTSKLVPSMNGFYPSSHMRSQLPMKILTHSRFSRTNTNAQQPNVNQHKNCSPNFHEFANFFSPENIAVWSCYQQKTVDRPISAHAHFLVFSVFRSARFHCTTTSLGGN
jgi:hypothetical protein